MAKTEEHLEGNELDRLRDLRALVLRHATISPRELNRSRWAEVVKAARSAMTPETFDPAASGDAQ